MVAEATVAEATVSVVERKHRPAQSAMWRRSHQAASNSTAALAGSALLRISWCQCRCSLYAGQRGSSGRGYGGGGYGGGGYGTRR